jgi:DNA/RNA endonuclease G (NUC1)
MPLALWRRLGRAARAARPLAAGLAAAAGCTSADRVAAPAAARPRDVAPAALPAVRFAEFHYDNAGADQGERIEISGPAGASLAGWSVVLYNGSGGAPYGTRTFTAADTIPAACGARGVVVLAYPQDGIQNGAPDGMALVDAAGRVVEFLSYEGAFTAVGGPADGVASVDVGVSEGTNTPVGASLARTAAGAWSGPAPNTFGACNDGDGAAPEVGPLDRVTVTPATAAVAEGATVTLAALAEDAEGDDVAAGTVVWSDLDGPNVTVTPSADGRSATVRGDLAGGPAQVVASLTVGGVTRADTVPVTVTPARPPGSTARIVFSGFNTAPLPPGFEDQLFARAFSGPSNADSLPGVAIAWRAVTPEVGTIDADGVVRGVADGRALFEARSADGFLDTAFVDVRTPQDPATARYGNHAEFGRPADATPGDDFVVEYPEFVASYNRSLGQPNWVAYNLEATHRGPAERCDCFTFDQGLPADFPRVSTRDYTGSGFTRGHMVMSEDRTTGPAAPQTSVDNARTFLFTNIVPQLAENNGGPWLALESYLGDLATRQNKEVYVLAGGARHEGTLKDEGRVAVPTRTWKVAVVMDRDRGLADAASPADLEVIAVDMPNRPQDVGLLQGRSWEGFRVSVDSVEALTGYDLLAALPDGLECRVEQAVAAAADCAPEARLAAAPGASASGAATVRAGEPLAFTTSALDEAGGGPWRYTIDWGDGTGFTANLTSLPTAQRPLVRAKAWAAPGAYAVTLRITDRTGRTGAASTPVTVTP